MKEYKGVVVPMITPVTADERVDSASVARIIELFAQSEVSPLLLGTTGEGNSVSSGEALKMVERACAAMNKRRKVYVGLTGNSFIDQVRAAEDYRTAGADVIVATLPSYYALTSEQMYGYYSKLADSVKLPVMLYNITATTHMSIPVDVVERLAKHGNIVGLKDSERDLERMKQCIALSKDNASFAYFCGWAAMSAQSLILGGDGIVPSTGNLVPEMFAELCAAALRGDTALADRLQKETDEIAVVYQGGGRTLGQTLAALKVMMGIRDLCSPSMMTPLSECGEEERTQVKEKTMELLNKYNLN